MTGQSNLTPTHSNSGLFWVLFLWWFWYWLAVGRRADQPNGAWTCHQMIPAGRGARNRYHARAADGSRWREPVLSCAGAVIDILGQPGPGLTRGSMSAVGLARSRSKPRSLTAYEGATVGQVNKNDLYRGHQLDLSSLPTSDRRLWVRWFAINLIDKQ